MAENGSTGNVVGDDKVASFVCKFLPCVVDELIGLSGEANYDLGPFRRGERADRSRDVGILFELELEAFGFLDFVVSSIGYGEVANGCAADEDVCREGLVRGAEHVSSGFDLYRRDS